MDAGEEKHPTDFLSIYAQDFKGEKTERAKMFSFEDTPEPITIAFQDVLLPEKYKFRRKTFDTEPMSSFYSRILEKKPDLKEHIDSEPDVRLLEELVGDETKSLMQHDYQWKGFEIESLLHLRTDLPSDWDIPKTTYRKSFRDFGKIVKNDLRTEQCPPPPSNLAPRPKLREILKVRTGETDYQRNIGTLGSDVIREHFYGDIENPCDDPLNN